MDNDDHLPGNPASLMARRRNVAPRRLVAPGPDQACLVRIVEAAAHAPDHGRLRPWRFVLIPPDRRDELGEAFVEALVRREPDCDDTARARARERAFHAPCLLAAILVDECGEAPVPTAEKLVSLGCAIQNLLVTGLALGYASGLASGGALQSAGMRRLLRLAAHEQAVCFIAFGTEAPAAPRATRARPQPGEFFSVL